MSRSYCRVQPVRAIAAILLVFSAIALPATAQDDGESRALHWWRYTITVPASLGPNDLHVTFSGTGGTIANVAVVPPGVVTVPGGNTVNVVWGANLVPGTVVTITFSTQHPAIFVVGGSWTKNGEDIGVPIAAGDEDSFEETAMAAVPAMSEWGLIVFTLLLLAVGTVLLGRRRRAAA